MRDSTRRILARMIKVEKSFGYDKQTKWLNKLKN